jgi:hypothetical protein
MIESWRDMFTRTRKAWRDRRMIESWRDMFARITRKAWRGFGRTLEGLVREVENGIRDWVLPILILFALAGIMLALVGAGAAVLSVGWHWGAGR